MMPLKTLIFIPTYNERDNVGKMAGQLLALGLDADLLFMDDNSPDGSGEILDRLASENPRLFVLHRKGKLGIGSAHRPHELGRFSQSRCRRIEAADESRSEGGDQNLRPRRPVTVREIPQSPRTASLQPRQTQQFSTPVTLKGPIS